MSVEDPQKYREELVSCDLRSLPKAIAKLLGQNRVESYKQNRILYQTWKYLKEREIPDSILTNCVRSVLDSTVASFSNSATQLTPDHKLYMLDITIKIINFLKDREVPLEDALSIFRGANKILSVPYKDGHAKTLRTISLQCLKQSDLNFDDCVVQEIVLWHFWNSSCAAIDVVESVGQKDSETLESALLKRWSSTLNCPDSRTASTFICVLIKCASSRRVDVFDVLSNLELKSPLKATVQVLSQRRVEDANEQAQLDSVHREYLPILDAICIHYLSVVAEEKEKNLCRIAEVSFSILKCYMNHERALIENVLLLLQHVLYHRRILSPAKLGELCVLVANLEEVLPLSDRDHSLWKKGPMVKFATNIAPLTRECTDPATATKIANVFMRIAFIRLSIAPSSEESLEQLNTALKLIEPASFFKADQKSPVITLNPRRISELLGLYGPDNVDPSLLIACVVCLRREGGFLCDYIDASDPNKPKWLALEVYALLRLNADEESISYVKDRFTDVVNDEIGRAIMVIMDLRLKAQSKSNIEDPSSKTGDNVLIESAMRGIKFGVKHMQLSEAVIAELEAVKASMKEKMIFEHESAEQMDIAELNTNIPIAFGALCYGNLRQLSKYICGTTDYYKHFKNMPYWVLLSTFVLDDMRTAAAFLAVNGDYGNQLKVLACLDLLLQKVKAPKTHIIDIELQIFDALLFTGCVENARQVLEKVESRMAELQMYSEDFFYFGKRIKRSRVFLYIEENPPSPPDNLKLLTKIVSAYSREKLRLFALQKYYHGKALEQWNLNRTGHSVSTEYFDNCIWYLTTVLRHLREKNFAMTSWEHLELSYLIFKSHCLKFDSAFDRLRVRDTIGLIYRKSEESQRAVSIYFLLDDLERLIRVSLHMEIPLDSKMSVLSVLIDTNRTSPAVEASPITTELGEPFALRTVDSIPYDCALQLKLKQHQIDVAERRVPAKEFLKFSKRRGHKKECKCHLCVSIGVGLVLKRIDATTSGTTKEQFVPLKTSFVLDRLGSGLRAIAKVLDIQVLPDTRCEKVLQEIQISHVFHLAQGYAADGNFNESLRVLDGLGKLELSPEDRLESAVRRFEYTYQINWQAALSVMGVYSNTPVEMIPTPFSGDAFKTPIVSRRRDVKNIQVRRRIRIPSVNDEQHASSVEDSLEKKTFKKAEEKCAPDAGEALRSRKLCDTRAQKAAPLDRNPLESVKPMFIPMDELKNVNTRRRKQKLALSSSESVSRKIAQNAALQDQNPVESVKPKFIPIDEFKNINTRRRKRELVLARSESALRKIESTDDLFDPDEEMSFLETFSKMSFKNRLKKPKDIDQGNADEEFRKLIEAARGCTLISKQCLVTDLFQCLAFLSAHRKQTLEAIFYLERSLGIGVQQVALSRGESMTNFFGRKVLASDFLEKLRPTTKFDPHWHEGIWDWCDKDWLIVQLSTIMEGGTTPGLLAVRYEHGYQPSIVHLSSKHDLQFQDSLFKHFDDLQMELKVNRKANEGRRTYWDRRHRGDELLREFCSSLENSWMGCWKGFFRAAISGPESRIIDNAIKRVNHFAKSRNLCPDQRMLYIGLQGLDVLQIDQLTSMLVKVLDVKTVADIHSVQEFARSLISTEERENLAKARRKPMILILDKYLINLPFDSCSLFSNGEQTRMPSVPFTVAHAQLMSERRRDDGGNPFALPNPLDGFYVVNPGDNLPACQQRFLYEMKALIDIWQGTIGEPMNEETFRKYLQSKSVYFYSGHGTGRQHMNVWMDNLNIRAVVFLFGCSSARMRRIGSKMDSEGYALRVLGGGSPAVLGNLWNVTDKDTDLLSFELLRLWLYKIFPNYIEGANEPQLGAALNKSRSKCELGAINGFAPVIFGLPCTSFLT